MSYRPTAELSAALSATTYPGRGIILGQTADGKHAAMAYFIMGRSENSRNRIFIDQGETVRIEPFDYAKVSDPSLIIYHPLRTFGNRVIVTNGDQTDTVYDFLRHGKTFAEALATRCYEPDSPNFTPRISGMFIFGDGDFSYDMHICRCADPEGERCERFQFTYPALPGVGHFLHTYLGDGNPIPSFAGEPERVALPSDFDVFADTVWNSLDGDNKVSLAVRFYDLSGNLTDSRIYNKNK